MLVTIIILNTFGIKDAANEKLIHILLGFLRIKKFALFKHRLENSLKSVNAVPKSDWSIVSKFNKLSVDVTAQLASVSHLNWLQVPGEK